MQLALLKLLYEVKRKANASKRKHFKVVFTCSVIPFENKYSKDNNLQFKRKYEVQVPNDEIPMTSHSGNISQIRLINLLCSNLFQMWFMVG